MNKKTLLTPMLLMATFLFIGCSSDTDNFNNDTFKKVQGKWKLTSYFTDVGEDENGNPIDTNISNGYELELKANKTFTSNEVTGFTGGTYTVIKSPGTNLRLVYQNGSQQMVRYKYIISVDDQELGLSYSELEPINDGAVFFEGLILTPVP